MARETVLRRAGGRCEGCARRVSIESLHAHHRKLRSQGGAHCPSNLLAFCPKCHWWAHAHVAEAREVGWILPSWACASVPVVLRDGAWLLLPDGSREVVDDGPLPLSNVARDTTRDGESP